MAKHCTRYGRSHGKKVCRKFSGSKRSGLSGAKSCTKANGRLKKGFRYGKGGRCVKAKG